MPGKMNIQNGDFSKVRQNSKPSRDLSRITGRN